MTFFINYLFTNPQYFFAMALVVIFSICCHEFMHAWVALQQGDSTAAEEGHLTLNPFKQMGWMSLVVFAMIGIAWGAVPVRPARMNHRWSIVAVSLAGPLTNLGLCILFGIASFAVGYFLIDPALIAVWLDPLSRRVPDVTYGFAFVVLWQAALLNGVMFLLNMMPIPGLDGWEVFTYWFPRIRQSNSELVRAAMFLTLLMVFFLFRLLFMITGN